MSEHEDHEDFPAETEEKPVEEYDPPEPPSEFAADFERPPDYEEGEEERADFPDPAFDDEDDEDDDEPLGDEEEDHEEDDFQEIEETEE